MLQVLILFLIPIGGGIPAGVLFARAHGIPWAATSALYLVSDIMLAAAFEPLMLLVIAAGRRVPFLARLAWAFKTATLQLTARYRGAGPFALIMIAFGADPMTGRAAAAAAGHGFVSGWAIAIAGDMLYFWVVMASTLKLSAYLGDSNMAMWLILGAMLLFPLAVRAFKAVIARLKRPEPFCPGTGSGQGSL